MKKYICLIAGLLCLAVFTACGRGYVPMPPADEFTSTTMAITEDETERETTKEEPEETEAATEAATAQTNAAATTVAAARTSAATTTQRNTVAATTTKVNSTALATTTTATTRPMAAPTAAPTNPPAPVYTQADYDAIIAEVRRYAESRTNARFIWDPTLTRAMADQGLAGFHGMPNLTRHGKDSVISSLKYHVDLTEEHVARNACICYNKTPPASRENRKQKSSEAGKKLQNVLK